MEPPTRIPVGRWRAGLHDRRLSGLRPDDAEPRQARERASPVEAVRRGHDERPADARAEGGVRFDSRLFREPRVGVRHGRGHPARKPGGVRRNVRLGRRPGHLVALGPQGGHGGNPDDPARLDFSHSSGRLSRLLDLRLPGDRRLSQTKEMTMPHHAVVSREQWLEARKAHLAREKEFTRLRDQLSAERRAMPWVKVDKTYVFEGPKGKVTLGELFDGRSQLIVYHFMFGPGWEQGCKSCSYLADHFDGANWHLPHRDATLAVISRAPLSELEPYKKRMGWRFKWLSSHGNDFNFDYHVSATDDEKAKKKMFYNYQTDELVSDEMPGLSVFYKDKDGQIFHTYSTYARGLDMLVGTYNFLDLVPKGRDENPDSTMDWVRRHDEYDA